MLPGLSFSPLMLALLVKAPVWPGWALCRLRMRGVIPHLESGELVEIPPDLRPSQLDVTLIVAHRRNLSRRVRAFMTWVEAVMVPYLE
ncbi:hypothetical protein [Thalassospira sp. TSL5-1]|uniref:hypothetical protein n=1 Tax=Thalassospira sp. TSL5-1 TaxID=1544451 RepID=UPI00093B2AB5|nr:hypothetical protein [Thalassospira sp. TSL5-1]